MIRGEAQVTLKDGRTFTLAMGFRALAMAAADTKIPVPELLAVMGKDDGRQMIVILSLFNRSLQKNHPEISMFEVDDMIFSNFEAITKSLVIAMTGAFSDDREDGKEELGNDQAGTGTNFKKVGRRLV